MNIIKFMEQWSAEYFDEILRRERKHNHTYQKALQQLLERADQISALCDSDSPVSAYSSAVYKSQGIESELLYAQGYRDCFALMHFLKLIQL